MTSIPEVPLRPEPYPGWQVEFDRLMRIPYLAKKYDRRARLLEHFDFLREHLPELMDAGTPRKGVVVDVGPGPGEALEFCRSWGWNILGVEAPSGVGGMGDDYHALSKLMHDRQKIPVRYCGFQAFAASLHRDCETLRAALFSFRGSWAQCFADCVDGPPHHLHHDVHEQWWRFDMHTRDLWMHAFEGMAKRLVPGGHVLIAANRLGEKSNQVQYDREIMAVAEVCGFSLVVEDKGYIYKWQKI